MQSFCKKFEVKIFIRDKKNIKRIITTITKNTVDWAKKINVNKTLLVRKNIEIIKKRLELVVFRVKTKNNKKILKKNDF